MHRMINSMAIAIWAVIFLVGVPGHARASDYFDAATGTIHLREVAVGDVIYKRVGVGLGQVQSLAQVAPRTATSIYSPSSGLLSIPFIRAETTAFTNAAVSITDVRYVESDLRAKTPLPSGETYGACKAAVLAAWQQTPRYIVQPIIKPRCAYWNLQQLATASDPKTSFLRPELV